jgi:hypothetical protein
MAKSSRSTARSNTTSPAKPTSQAEAWLTAAEQKLLDGTLGRSLAEASQKQLQATIAKARTLRDKWRDLFNRQMKSSKRTARRGDQVNSRSLDKADLFAAAVRRVESRLAELVDGVTTAVTGRPTTKRPTKSARAAGHRSTRASVRTSLAKAARAASAPAKPAATKKAARKKTASKKTSAVKKGVQVSAARAAAATAGDAPVKPAAKTLVRGTASKKARQAGKRKVTAAAGGAVGYDPKKQRSAKARATAVQFKFDGLSTRRRGHTLVSGKRKQARRDGR